MKRGSKRTNGDRLRDNMNTLSVKVNDTVMSALEDAATVNNITVETMAMVILGEWVLKRDAIMRGIPR